MLLFIFTLPNVSPPDFNSTFQFLIDLFNHIADIISNLKDFEILQNPGIRNHVISFCIVYPGNTQVYHPSLAVFLYHFIYYYLIFGSPTLSSEALLFIQQQLLAFHMSTNLLCQYSYENLPHDRKACNGPKMWCFISLLFNFQYQTSSSIHHSLWFFPIF